jgi:alkylation response protein AidB-like acyl-CoA dehydrogenase
MNTEFTEGQNAFRAECRAWLQENVPTDDLGSGDTREGFANHVVWEKALYANGWAAVSWPEEWGGRGADLVEWLIFEEEYYAAGAPARVTQNGIFLLAPTLFEFGTEEQKERILRPMAAAEVLWAQAWSEPNAGSDLANVASTARRVEGGWRVTGQKTWCTRGMFCHGLYGLFRTDPETARHKGLSYMMVMFDQEGVNLRGVERLDGDESFAEVFLDDAFVADTDVIGDIDEGWKVAMSTTSSERGLSLRSPGRFMATSDRLIGLWKAAGRPTAFRQRLAKFYSQAQAYRLYVYRTANRMMEGGHIGADSSLNKIWWSELDLEMHELAMELLGENAEVEDCDDARWLKDYMFALAGPIYAGTNEIQRSIVARRVLGLPRK